MTYRSLLVYLDNEPLCVDRTRVAAQVAARLDCHLVGIAPTGNVGLPVAPEGASSLAEYAALSWKALRDQAELAAESFREVCRALNVTSYEAVVDEADKAPSLVRHAHCSDLVVLSQAEPGTPSHYLNQALVEQVVLYSARPTLILPYAGRVDTLGSHAMVAWDDSREAARALSDALPLLRLAKQVQVISWTGASGDDDMGLRPRLDALSRWLMWQGVSADVRVETTGIDITDAMLSRAADMSVDLIVMGAYGHSRWTERILGGATRGLLATMTVPVLMSH